MQTQNAEVPECDNPLAVEARDKSSDLTAFQVRILVVQYDPMLGRMAVLHIAHPTPLLTNVDD